MAGSALGPEALTPFDALAETYDRAFSWSQIGLAQRAAVHRELDRAFRPGQRILEINCGTGIDALYLAGRGVRVVACDASARMIDVARRRAAHAELEARPEFRVLATETIAGLLETLGRAHFDGALSNFAGLNCIGDLGAVARDLAALLKPGVPAVLCIFGRFCAWEVFWYLAHGNPAKGFRRFRRTDALTQLAPGVNVRVRYPSVGAMSRLFAPEFRLRRWKGVGLTVPPSYLEHWAGRFPRTLARLAQVDRALERWPLIRGLADHVLLIFERTTA